MEYPKKDSDFHAYAVNAYLVCHPRENGDPVSRSDLDSRLRGNDNA